MDTNDEKKTKSANLIRVVSFIIACCLIVLIPLWNAPLVDYSEWSSYGRKETVTSWRGDVYETYRGGYVGKTMSMGELMTERNYNHAAGDSMEGIAISLYIVAAIACLVVVFSEFSIARRKILYIPATVSVCNFVWYIYHFSEVTAQNPNNSVSMAYAGVITVIISAVAAIMCFASISIKDNYDMEVQNDNSETEKTSVSNEEIIKELLEEGWVDEDAEVNDN